jgi:hypothetical protein
MNFQTKMERSEDLSLSESAKYLLDECRMVLPGIQALFGFQLIVVFSSEFHERLAHWEQCTHLFAIGLIACAIALIMTPATLHRRSGPNRVYESFLDRSSRLLLASMVPLELSIGIDFFLVARIILGSVLLPLVTSLFVLCVFTFLWFGIHRR